MSAIMKASLLRPSVRLFGSKAATSQSDTKVSILSNGLKVASENTGGEVASLALFVEVGSRHEDAQTNGATHFLGHLSTQGSSNKSKSQLEAEVESLGGSLQISTSREYTTYKLNFLKNHASKALEILSDVVTNVTYPAASVESERSKILKEMDKSSVRDLMFDHLHATAFQGSSLSQTVLGSAESVKGISADGLKEFKKKHFYAQNMVLAAAGGINHDELASLAEQKFGKIQATGSAVTTKTPYFVGSDVRIRDDDEHDAHILFAVQGASAKSPDAIPLMVAQYIMGSWDASLGGGKNLASRLSQSIAHHGLCSSYSAFSANYSDTGLFGFYAIGTKRTRLDDLMFQFQNDWVRICVNASDSEVQRAKAQLKAAFHMNLDSPCSIANEIGRETLNFIDRRSLAEISYLIDSVDASSLRSVAYKYLYDKDPAIVVFGPVEGFPDYNRISTSWLRV